MSRNTARRIMQWCMLAAAIFMYQESSAQPKKPRPKAKPAAAAVVPASAPDVSYTVSMSRPETHLLEVEMRVSQSSMPAQLELKMPVWTPGSYLIREFARHVQDFSARDGNGGSLAWQKTSKNTWTVTTAGAATVVVRYRVYANELTVRTNELNDQHAFWNNSALLLFPAGHLNVPSTVTVVPFGNWKIATGLPKHPSQPNTFVAKNYDILYDSPFEVSDFKEITFTVQGKPHRYVITGEGNYDLKKLAADTTKIVEEAYKIFGELPYDDYTFIVNLRGGGGLEHLNSTALQYNRFGFAPASRYQGFLGLVAHEYFHLWNVKRIRPEPLGPFDYENENYTKLLWVAEGGTSYYGDLLLRRAGLMSETEFLAGRGSTFEQLKMRPGRFETSLEEASFDAWIKYYRPDENAINNQISYYDKGDVVSMLLDVTIRTSTGGQRSLDDVFRYLYNEFYKKDRAYSPADFQKAAELAAGRSLEDFFAKYVRGEAELDVNSIVNGIGLELKEDEPPAGRAYLGADLADEAGRLNVRSVSAGTPAYEQGLNSGDQIIAIDGYRVNNQSFLTSYLTERKPGDKVRLTIFRFDKLRDITLTLGKDTRVNYTLAKREDATADQLKLYRDYLDVNE
jgi:predicted metalloprotease with PDZ domain